MKNIRLLLLAMACVTLFAACNSESSTVNVPDKQFMEDMKARQAATEASEPTGGADGVKGGPSGPGGKIQ